MALVLNQERFCNNLFRSFLLIPWAIPTVMSALNWRWIFDDASGLINNVLVRLELVDETISWLSNPHLATLSVIVVVVWQGTPFFELPGRSQAIQGTTDGESKGHQCFRNSPHHAARLQPSSLLR
jgi:ABC-type spermidine/putrescine transport system permease subunit I